MRVVVFSDVHGNLAALDAVLRAIDERGGADRYVVNGDLCAFGPRPVECLERLQALPDASFVQGNTDRYMLARPSRVVAGDSQGARLRAGIGWAAREVGEGGLRFLATLPTRQALHEPAEGSVLVVHASPRGDEEGIFPTTTPGALAPMLEGVEADWLVCGHTHVPSRHRLGRTIVVNEGAVGFPLDGDRRACYATLDATGHGWEVALHRVAYDVEHVVADLEARALPAGAIFADRLRRAAG